jgi:hypothetical protein
MTDKPRYRIVQTGCEKRQKSIANRLRAKD